MSQYGENQSTGSKVTGALGSLFGAGKKSDNPSSDSAGAGPGATNMQQSSNQESDQQQQQQRPAYNGTPQGGTGPTSGQQQQQQAYNGTPQGGTGPTSGQQQQHGRFDQPAGGAYGNQAGQEQLGYGAGRGGGGGGVYQGLDRGGGGGGYGTQLGGPQDKYAAAAAHPNSGVANQGAGYNGMQQGPQAGYGAPMSAASGNPEAGYGMQQGPQAGYGAPMGGAGGNPGAGYGAPIWRGGGGGGGGGNQGGASFQSQPGYGTLTRESQAPYQEAAGSYQPQPSGYGTQGTQAPNQGAQGYQPQGFVGNQGGPGQGPPTGYEKDEDRDRPNNQQQQQQQGQPGAGGGFPVDSGYGNTAAIAPGLFITISQKVPGQQGGDAAYASSYPYQGGNQAPNQGGQLQGGTNPRGMEPSSGSGAANAFGNQAPSQGMGQQQHHHVGFGGIPQYGTLQGGGMQQGPPNPVSDASPQITAPYGFQDGPRRYQEQQGGTAPAGALAAGVGAAGFAGPHGSNNTGYYGQQATTAANHQPSQDTGAGQEQQQFSGDNLENTQPGATGTTQSATPGAGSNTPDNPSPGEQIKQPDNNTAGNAPSEDNTTGAPDSSSGLPQSDGAGKGTSSTTTPTPTSSTTKAAGTGDGSPMPNNNGTSGANGTATDVGKKKSGGLVSKIKNKLHI
ncbi:unnamed protein product [Sphagnum balticum]